MSQFINITSLFDYLDLIKQLEVDAKPLLATCGIDHQMLVTQVGFIPFAQFVKLLELTAYKTRNEHLGLLMSKQRAISHLGTTGVLVEKCPDVRTSLTTLFKYIHLHTPAVIAQLSEDRDSAMITYRIIESVPAARQVIDLTISGLCNVISLFASKKIKPLSIYLSHDGGSQPGYYQSWFKTRVIFNHELNAIVFERKWLDQAVDSYNKTAEQIIRRELDAISQNNASDTLEAVRKLIMQLLPSGRCDVKTVAGQLMMSERKLQYLLSEQQIRFKQLVDQCRMSIAQQQLKQSNMSLTELSNLLGYSEQSAFSRAFKIWFGINPRQWRKQHASP